MLQNKIQSTIGLIDDVIDNRNIETENANVARRNTAFFYSLEKLSPIVLSYTVARNYFNFKLSNESNLKLKGLMEYSKESFENGKAVNPDAFRKNVDAFIDDITVEWNDFYKARIDNLINDLNIMKPFYPLPAVITGCVQSLKKCEKFPLSKENAQAHIDAEKKSKELLEQVHFDDTIKAFLKKISQRMATLNDITPEIMEWIKTENIADKITLGIKLT